MSILFALALAFLGAVPVAAPASAHATMAASWPADGQVLAEPDSTPTPPAPAAADAAADSHLRTLFPGAMILALVGLSVMTLRRQSRTHPG